MSLVSKIVHMFKKQQEPKEQVDYIYTVKSVQEACAILGRPLAKHETVTIIMKGM